MHRGGIVTPSSPSVYYGGKGPGAGYYYSDRTFGGRYKITYLTPITSDVPPIVALFPGPLAKGWFHAFRNIGSPGRWTGFEIGHHLKTPWDGALPSGPISKDLSAFDTGWEYVAANPEVCPMSSERFGLRVFDSAGRLVFDSGTPTLRIVAPLVSWTQLRYAQFENAWPFPMDGTHGVLASSLAVYLEEGTNFGNTFVSPRIGFSSARPGKVLMGFYGTDSISDARLALDGNYQSLLNQTGGLRTFVVRIG